MKHTGYDPIPDDALAPGTVFSDVIALGFEYIGRDGKNYYACECRHCKSILFRNQEQMAAWKCENPCKISSEKMKSKYKR